MKTLPAKPVYLDCNSTTPVDPAVAENVTRFLTEEFGNAGSRTHAYGGEANKAVNRARKAVAEVAGCAPEEVVFTSGATESNNLAILGLSDYGLQNDKRHIISTAIEHKAVLEPLEVLQERGFEITLLPPTPGGWVEPASVKEALRKDTLLVSVMHSNNETGILQSLEEIAGILEEHEAYLHTDAAQGFGKDIETLRNPRIDMISVSGHKLYAPKGVGALILRDRDYDRPPVKGLMVGGGQEYGLRPGTQPVHLIVGLGKACELALAENEERLQKCRIFKENLLSELAPLEPALNGDQERALPTTVNLSIPGVNSEAAMIALRDIVAISNGAACTSAHYETSHVLKAMNLPDDIAGGALRWSWFHDSPTPCWESIRQAIGGLK